MENQTVRFADIKLVINVPRPRTFTRRKATTAACVDFMKAEDDFNTRASPATWSRLVRASRRLHTLKKAERAAATKKMEALRQQPSA